MKKKKKISDSKPSFCAYLRINAPATPVALVFAHFSRNSFYRISVMFEKCCC